MLNAFANHAKCHWVIWSLQCTFCLLSHGLMFYSAVLQDVISFGCGGDMMSEYKSMVYYHEDKPKWFETFKVSGSWRSCTFPLDIALTLIRAHHPVYRIWVIFVDLFQLCTFFFVCFSSLQAWTYQEGLNLFQRIVQYCPPGCCF